MHITRQTIIQLMLSEHNELVQIYAGTRVGVRKIQFPFVDSTSLQVVVVHLS